MTDSAKTTAAGDRLAKVIARSGLCSRRDAEEWIRGGRVAVNGAVIRTPAFNVTEKDKIKVDGAPLATRSGTRVWLYHKPPGLVVTEKDPEGRATIFEALEQAGLPRVLTIGRLDLNTEGLLLLTNDGGLKRVLELPATGWLRRYRVRAFGSISQAQLDGLKHGIELEGVKYGPIEAELEREQGSNVWLVVSLREGKNREVKNVLASLGLQVNRLIRVSYGPFQLGDLAVGGIEVVKARVLREQLGKKLAEEAGVDFDSEMPEPAAIKRAARPVERADLPPQRLSPRDREGDRGRPPRRDKPVSDRPAPKPRRILFDDGRPPEEFVPAPPPRPKGELGAKDDRPPRGDRPARDDRPAGAARPPRREDRPQGDRPPRRDDRPRGDRPPRPADRPKGDRPPRRDDRPTGARPPRRNDRPEGARPPRPAGARPPRTDRPQGARPPRRDGDRPHAAQRPDRKPYAGRDGARPAADADRRPRSAVPSRAPRPGGPAKAARPSGARPGGPPRGARPGGPPKGPRPAGGKPPRKPRP